MWRRSAAGEAKVAPQPEHDGAALKVVLKTGEMGAMDEAGVDAFEAGV